MDFERQIGRHKDAVYRQMLRVCGNADDAEDVLVEAMLRAYKNLGRLEDSDAFRAWLTTIGKRVCFRLKQKEASIKKSSLESLLEAGLPLPASDEPSAQDLIEMGETHRCVMEAFESLDPIYKDVYRMRELDGLSAEETAQQLGITVAAVKSRLHRARGHVRKMLDESLSA